MSKTIVLINPPLYYEKGAPHSIDASVPPLGILYLASYINRYSTVFKARVIDAAHGSVGVDAVTRKVKELRPFAIGVSAMTAQLQGALELAHSLKGTTAPLFLGGPHISGDPEFIERHGSLFDYAITGEAEITFLKSLVMLHQGRSIPRLQAGEVVRDLDTIPFPDRSLVDRRQYSRHESMIFSRGCPYSCYYCSRPAVSKKVRYRSAANMVDEIEQTLVSSGGKIDFQDDTMTMNRRRIGELCAEIRSRSLKLDWECNTRIDLVDDNLLGAMKQAGCSLIHFGIESGSEDMRRNQVRKGSFSNLQIKEVFDSCRRHGIRIACYFMVGHPGETKETLDETRAMILGSGIDLLGVSIPTPFPGSELYAIAEASGIISTQTLDDFATKKLGSGYAGIYPVYIPDTVEEAYLFEVLKDVNRRFYINVRTFWTRLKQDVVSPSRFRKDAIDLLSMVKNGVPSRKPYRSKAKHP